MGVVKNVVLALGLGAAGAACAQQEAQQLDRIFARFTDQTPGCVVGVAQGGKPALIKAYGMADLEHGVPNTADTIFESGSVAKQFTAAAVALLAQDGKLALDDQVRKYIPELPDYGYPLTIRHMLNHTAGLRDWGGVAEIGGWARGTRAYTHASVLEIVARQRKLNFEPGTQFSYSNTGYSLAAMIVERVSGQSLPAFTRERIFAPLGMHGTSWRDDYTRVVKGRAIAYQKKAGTYYTTMPFENTYGHGAMLTTVADLLKWQDNFSTQLVGGAQLASALQTPGKFNDGAFHNYGLGLFMDSYRGLPWIQHSGATAGYRTFLSRFPDQKLAVALLCNSADADPGAATRQLGELFLAGAGMNSPAPPAPAFAVSLAQMDARAGMYTDPAGRSVTLVPAGAGLELDGVPLRAIDATRVRSERGTTFGFGKDGAMSETDRFGRHTVYKRVEPVDELPDAAGLADLAGVYYSEDADARWTVHARDGKLLASHRAGLTVELTPRYRDAFAAQGGLVIFRRDSAGRVSGLSVVQERVRDMPFEKLRAAAPLKTSHASR